MQKYDSYKESGIEWIGEIPQSWDYLKVRNAFYLKGRIGWQGLKADEFIDKGPFLVTGTDFENGKVNWNTCYHISQERYDEAPEIHVENGDVLITKDGTVGKMAYVENKPDKVSLNSHLLIIRPIRKDIYNKYVFWAFQTSSFTYYKGLAQTGSIMESLSQEKIGSYVIPFPPYTDQKGIANYLDYKCAKVDNLISSQQKRIELLKELKQSVISKALIRGINPDVKMKDSGIEWIGEVPEHWGIMRLNELGKYRKGPFGSALKVTMFVRKGKDTIKVYQQQNAINKNWELGDDYISGEYYRESMQSFTVEPRDIIVSCAGTIGECYIMPDNIEKGIINQALMKMKMDERKVELKYFLLLFDLMLKEESAKSSNGSAIKNIPPFDIMKKMRMPLPSKDEQKKILQVVSDKLLHFDSAISKALRQIKLLNEYKQSLITEVVTGKRKVI